MQTSIILTIAVQLHNIPHMISSFCVTFACFLPVLLWCHAVVVTGFHYSAGATSVSGILSLKVAVKGKYCAGETEYSHGCHTVAALILEPLHHSKFLLWVYFKKGCPSGDLVWEVWTGRTAAKCYSLWVNKSRCCVAVKKSDSGFSAAAWQVFPSEASV